MPVDVYEGPAMNHSYHEMIIGHGKCFSTVILSEKQDQIRRRRPIITWRNFWRRAGAQKRGRAVVALVLKDLSERTLDILEDFFHRTV